MKTRLVLLTGFFLLVGCGMVLAGGGGAERFYYSGPPTGLQFHFRPGVGSYSVYHNRDRLPPPHFWHGGRPGYNMPNGQQVVIVQQGSGFQAMDFRTALVIEGFTTFRGLLAWLTSGPRQAQAATVPAGSQGEQQFPQGPQGLPPNDPRMQGQGNPCEITPACPGRLASPIEELPYGLYVTANNEESKIAVEKELLARRIPVVKNRSKASSELIVTGTPIDDPYWRIELELVDLGLNTTVSRSDGTSNKYSPKGDSPRLKAIGEAAAIAVRELKYL